MPVVGLNQQQAVGLNRAIDLRRAVGTNPQPALCLKLRTCACILFRREEMANSLNQAAQTSTSVRNQGMKERFVRRERLPPRQEEM